ncbi:hypothetical protein C7S18_23310 [Ahniella affigens]|uniref:Uncharacterized protein n=1 Tax=Ahniella affigens TaxID=2021234 RepID=A0A2P1PYM0_9GAMM|nr:hypothetical protein [Ahniella affigens]AVP99923.1 hypothetical protein C7S18_23310 [Ahniella affigens]
MMSVSIPKPITDTPTDGWLQHKRQSQHFDVSECLLGAIQLAQRESRAVVLVANQRRLFRIDASTRRFSLLDRAIKPGDWLTPVHQTEILTAEHRSVESIGHASGDLSDLLWDAGYHGSQGRLPMGAHPYDVIQLQQWPNLTRVAHGPDTARICALLVRSRATVAMVSRWLKVPIEDVHRTYAAASAAGLVSLRFSGAKLDRANEMESRRDASDDTCNPSGEQSAPPAVSGFSGFLGRMVARLRKL